MSDSCHKCGGCVGANSHAKITSDNGMIRLCPDDPSYTPNSYLGWDIEKAELYALNNGLGVDPFFDEHYREGKESRKDNILCLLDGGVPITGQLLNAWLLDPDKTIAEKAEKRLIELGYCARMPGKPFEGSTKEVDSDPCKHKDKKGLSIIIDQVQFGKVITRFCPDCKEEFPLQKSARFLKGKDIHISSKKPGKNSPQPYHSNLPHNHYVSVTYHTRRDTSKEPYLKCYIDLDQFRLHSVSLGILLMIGESLGRMSDKILSYHPKCQYCYNLSSYQLWNGKKFHYSCEEHLADTTHLASNSRDESVQVIPIERAAPDKEINTRLSKDKSFPTPEEIKDE